MNIVVLGFDRDLLDPQSAAALRQTSFAERADVRLNIFLLSRVDRRADVVLSDRIRVRAWTGNVVFRLCGLFVAAAKEIRAAKTRKERVLITAQDPFIAGMTAFKLSRLLDVPYEVQEHGDFYSGYWEREVPFVNRLLSYAGRFALRRADAVRVVSERIRDRCIARMKMDPARITVRSVWQDLSWHLNRPARPWPETPTIVIPCRFVAQKGIDTLIDACDRLAKNGVKFRARLIGKGPLEARVRADIAARGLADRIVIEPWADQASLWGDADLFVCSSRYEGWGRTIIEAMAAGVPVVTTDVGCVGSVLRPQVDGRVVQPNDAGALARDIRQQFEESDRRAWMATNARERVKEMMISPEKSAEIQRTAWRKIEDVEQMNNETMEQSSHQTITSSLPPSRRSWIATTALIAFASFIRLTSFVLFWKSLGANREWGFFTIVQNWFLGYGYSLVPAVGCASAYRSPGYLFFLTGVYGVFGFANFFAQALIQNLLAILLVYLVYRLGWSISRDRRVGLIAGFLIAVHPYTFYHYTQYYHTAISGCFLVGLLLALHALERTKRWRWAGISGILIALLAYIQGTILPATALLSLWLLIRWWPNWKRAIGAIAIMAIVSVAMIAPWTYRNWTIFHAFVPLTTDLGHALAKANHPLNYAMTALGYPQEAFDETADPLDPLKVRYALLPEVADDLRAHGVEPTDNYFFGPEHPAEPGLRLTCDAQRDMNEVAFNEYWTGQANAWIAENYWPDVVQLQAQKIVQFWSPALSPGKKYGAAWSFGNESLLATLARYGLVAYVLFAELLAVAGLAIAFRRRQWASVVPILIIFAVYTALHSFFAGYTKYRIPLDNLLVVLSAIGFVQVWDACRRKTPKPSSRV